MDFQFSMFYLILTASLLTILSTSTNLLYAIIWMILSFLLTAIYFILNGVDFLGILYIIVYVGAISILFLIIHMHKPRRGLLIPILPNIEIVERHDLIENIGYLLYGDFALFNFIFCLFLLAIMIPIVAILKKRV